MLRAKTNGSSSHYGGYILKCLDTEGGESYDKASGQAFRRVSTSPPRVTFCMARYVLLHFDRRHAILARQNPSVARRVLDSAGRECKSASGFEDDDQ